MHAYAALTLFSFALANAQSASEGSGEGYPDPPQQTLDHTKSGVLPVLPTPSADFTGVAINEGAIIYDGPMNPTFMPMNGLATTATSLPMATYQAILPSNNFDDGFGSLVTGDIMVSSSTSSPGVMVNVNFQGFPSESMDGPFVYHIHALPVPADGNCSATMGHLDPTNRGEYYPCNPADPASCQVGDLSGKHGNITSISFMTSYMDSFLSTNPSSPAYFGDLSVVIHSSNATRITCANFMMMNAVANGTSGSATGTMGSGGMPYSGPVQTGAAATMVAGSGTIAVAFVALMLLK